MCRLNEIICKKNTQHIQKCSINADIKPGQCKLLPRVLESLIPPLRWLQVAEATNDKSALGVGFLMLKGVSGLAFLWGGGRRWGLGVEWERVPCRPRGEEASPFSALPSLFSSKGLGFDSIQDLCQFTDPSSKMSRMKALGLRQ